MIAPSPAWLTEHTAVVEAVLAEHQPEDVTEHYCSCIDYRLDAPWTTHVAAAITAALAAEAEKGGAS